MNSALISVGLPVVKTTFLIKSIQCCLSQTYENIEIIVQNNASDVKIKEEIREIILNFNDKRIKYFENVNQIPMVQNWNAALEKADGEYFAILCDDDIWEPTFLEEILNLSNKFPNTNIFHTRNAIVDETDKIKSLSQTCPDFENGKDFIIHRLLGHRTIYLSDFVVKTNAIKNIGGFVEFPDGWGSDTFTWFKISLNGGIAYTSKVLFNYRVSRLNVSNSKKINNKYIAIEMQHEMLKKIIKDMEFSDDKYDIIQKDIFKQEIIKFKDKSKKFIFYKILINKYKLPESLAFLISLVYQYYIRNLSKQARIDGNRS
jgi:glycosyltransferase involved in cell wall biosynthesis